MGREPLDLQSGFDCFHLLSKNFVVKKLSCTFYLHPSEKKLRGQYICYDYYPTISGFQSNWDVIPFPSWSWTSSAGWVIICHEKYVKIKRTELKWSSLLFVCPGGWPFYILVQTLPLNHTSPILCISFSLYINFSDPSTSFHLCGISSIRLD